MEISVTKTKFQEQEQYSSKQHSCQGLKLLDMYQEQCQEILLNSAKFEIKKTKQLSKLPCVSTSVF